MRFSAIIGAAAIPLAVSASHLGGQVRRHHGFVARNPQPQNSTEGNDLEKRGQTFSGRFTFYDVGLGACGQTNVASDFIVALNSDQYGSGYPGPECFKTITINYNGKSAQATIMDECPGCPYGGLDFSRGLFDHFASEDVGVLYGTWSYNDGSSGGSGGSGDTTTSSKKTTSTRKTTSTHSTTSSTPTPTTHSSTHTTSTHSSTPTSTSHSSSSTVRSTSTTSTVTSTASVDVSVGVASGLAQTTGTVAPAATATSNLSLLSGAIVYLGALVSAGAQAASH